METFEYGFVSLTVNRTSLGAYEYETSGGLGDDLGGVNWAPIVFPNGREATVLDDPGIIANHLGQRGWETFSVTRTDSKPPVMTYHFRRSSKNTPAAV